MKFKKFYGSILIFLGLIFAQTVTSFAQETLVENKPETIKNEETLVHFGDLIDVDIVGSFEYDWRGSINPEGFLDGVDFLEEPILGLCRSESDIAKDIVKGYSKLLREPKVVVKILDRSNRAVSMLNGAVKKPQRFQIKRPVNLNELIIISGGLTENASGEINIFRPQNLSCAAQKTLDENKIINDGEERQRFVKTSQSNKNQSINIRISDLLNGSQDANPQILSGDIITILESEPIYIIGGVNNPKQISSRSQMTLSRAISSAGGIAKEGQENQITIFRKEGRETKIIEADLTKINNKSAEDIILQKFDIIDVAQKGKDKKKFAPIVKSTDFYKNYSNTLPLTIID